MDMATALAELGVTATALDAQTRDLLDRDGYAALPDVLSGAQVEAVRTRLAELLTAEGERAGLEVHQEKGTDRLADPGQQGGGVRALFHRGPGAGLASPACWASSGSPRSTSAPRCRGTASRPCTPTGAVRCRPAATRYATRSGCSTISPPPTAPPGWYRARTGPARCRAWPCRIRPRRTPMRCRSPRRAGTVVIFNSHLWHGGTGNRSDRPRRALHGLFTRRDRPQQTDQKTYLRPETLARLSPAARFILDV